MYKNRVCITSTQNRTFVKYMAKRESQTELLRLAALTEYLVYQTCAKCTKQVHFTSTNAE